MRTDGTNNGTNNDKTLTCYQHSRDNLHAKRRHTGTYSGRYVPGKRLCIGYLHQEYGDAGNNYREPYLGPYQAVFWNDMTGTVLPCTSLSDIRVTQWTAD